MHESQPFKISTFSSLHASWMTSDRHGRSGRRFQSLEEQPRAQDQFEDRHWRIEPIRIDWFGEAWKKEIDDSTEDAPAGGNNSEPGERPRNVVRSKPQVAANRQRERKEREAYIVIVESAGDGSSGQDLQAIRFKDLEITRVAEKTKRAQQL